METARGAFISAMDDDLNTPAAAAALVAAVKLAERPELSRGAALLISEFFSQADAVFGVIAVGLPLWRAATIRSLSANEAVTLDKLEAARAAKNFEEADALREELLKQGIEVRNTPQGTVWQRDPFR